jgi:hypothetical protein
MDRSRGEEKMEDVSHQIGELRKEMREGFRDVRSEIKDVRSEIGLRIDSVHTSISTLWASMIGGYVAVIVAFILTRP